MANIMEEPTLAQATLPLSSGCQVNVLQAGAMEENLIKL